MAEAGNPRTWIPYMNSKDCSQGFCSLYCPQWCYIVYPPPPPFEYPEDDSSPNFSPLVIAIIGILATAFLLVSYYTLISKYCGPREPARRDQNDAFQDTHEAYQASTVGLDEAQIKSIAVFKYKQGFNFGDCSVCLSEFEDDERVRLLPKCNHAFHVPCIDTWLKSHSNCPLCRASVFSFSNASSSNENANENENESESESESGTSSDDVAVAVVVVVEDERINHERVYPKPALRAFSDLSGLQERQRVIEIRDEGACESVVRCVSMDRSFRIDQRSDVNDEEDGSSVEGCTAAEAGPSKRSRGESFGRRRLLHCVLSPIAMKRSFSSGRFSLGNKSGRGRIPV